MSLSKRLSFPLLRHGKLPLVPGYFQFPAPVLELSGPFSYKCRANQPSFLSTTHSFPNQTVRFERADKIFSFCCPTYNRIWKVLIFIPYLSHTHVAPLFLLPQPAPRHVRGNLLRLRHTQIQRPGDTPLPIAYPQHFTPTRQEFSPRDKEISLPQPQLTSSPRRAFHHSPARRMPHCAFSRIDRSGWEETAPRFVHQP